MKTNDKETVSLPKNNKDIQSVDRSRRSFTILGATLAPLMMTLANRSAWGGEVDLCTQSGLVSFNFLASQTAAYNKRSFTTPPNQDTTKDYSNMTPEQKLSAWQTWASDPDNDLTGEPFNTWTVTDWEAFVTNCYGTG